MALVNHPVMTEKNLAAHGRNGRQSHGAATPAGKERARAANLRHGMYSKLRNEALPALGEDPADLAALIDGSYQQWRPSNGSQAQLVEHLARLQWRMDRAERMQDNVVAEHVEKVAADRHEKTMNLRYQYVGIKGVLGLLKDYVLRRDFYAPPGLIHHFVTSYGDQLQGRAVTILELLHRLREPEELPPQTEPLPPGASDDEEWEMALAYAAENDHIPVPQPEVAVAQDAQERDELRETLSILVRQEKESHAEVWDPFFAKYMRPMTTAERDVVAAQVEPRLDRLRRHEESCVRQLWRLGNFLIHIQDRARQQDAEPEPEDRNPESGTKAESEVRHPESGMEAASDIRNSESGTEVASEIRNSESGIEKERAVQGGADLRNLKSEIEEQSEVSECEKSTQSTSKNAGASGDVYENKGKGNFDARQIDAIPAAVARPADASMTGLKAERDRKSDSRALESASDTGKAAAT